MSEDGKRLRMLLKRTDLEIRQSARERDGQEWIETKLKFDEMAKKLELMSVNDRMIMAKRIVDEWKQNNPEPARSAVETHWVQFFSAPDVESASEISDLFPGGSSESLSTFMEMVSEVMPKPTTKEQKFELF